MAASSPESNGAAAPLSAASIFRSAPPPPTRVDVPELGGYVFVRVLTAGERARLEASIESAKAKGESLPAHAVAACCCDESGRLLFEEGAARELATADSRVIDRIAAEAARLNLLKPADREGVEKNSEAPPSSGS
jgi:hypothetical protein